MRYRSRREFLADVGRGMLVAGVGAATAVEMGLAPASAIAAAGDGEAVAGAGRLSFGAWEPLVRLMQDTPADKLTPLLVERLKGGTDLRSLITAGALANARTFGGQDYVGYHSFMALAPAYAMSLDLPSERAALPVLKVLHRNTTRMQDVGGHAKEVLHEVESSTTTDDRPLGELLRDAERKGDMNGAEKTFASAMSSMPIGEAYNHLQFAVQDEMDVHRVVLAWRSWAMLDLAGQEYAHAMLRQSLRYCVHAEQSWIKPRGTQPGIRTILPKMLDQYKLVGKPLGDRRADDSWIEKLSEIVLRGGRERAADAVAAALAEGMALEDVGEAISLAANSLVLLDPGRLPGHAQANKPAGSVHGDSVGVHASDSANAWRNIARVGDARNKVASLIAAAYHTAGQDDRMGSQPYPRPEDLEKVRAQDPAKLLQDLDAAVKAKDQARAAAIVRRYGASSADAKPVFNVLLQFAVSEDGALHAEKYYRTVAEEFATMRPAFRWRQLIALARVTASEYGFPAPGYADACHLLKA